jgi:hypothetical protein
MTPTPKDDAPMDERELFVEKIKRLFYAGTIPHALDMGPIITAYDEAAREAMRPSADTPREGERAAPNAQVERLKVLLADAAEFRHLNLAPFSVLSSAEDATAHNFENGWRDCPDIDCHECDVAISQANPAAPDSREELKAKIDAMTCYWCERKMPRVKDSPQYHEHNGEAVVCDAKGAEILALLPTLKAESLAQKFHETYERLAPQFSYQTRKASAVPWENVPENNKKLMIAVAKEILRDRF